MLKKFTSASKKRINELILNEKCHKELGKNNENEKSLLQKLLHSTSKQKRPDKDDESNESNYDIKKPDKLLEAGKKLPKKFARNFTRDLIGVPLEEIDDYYKSDHVMKNNKCKCCNQISTLKNPNSNSKKFWCRCLFFTA